MHAVVARKHCGGVSHISLLHLMFNISTVDIPTTTLTDGDAVSVARQGYASVHFCF